MWMLWWACAPGGQRVVTLQGATYPQEPCAESEWGDEDPDPQVRLERVDGSIWVSSVKTDAFEPTWDEEAFDGVHLPVNELRDDGLFVIPMESDTQDVGTFVTELESEHYPLDDDEIRRGEFDVVAGCIEVRFTLDR